MDDFNKGLIPPDVIQKVEEAKAKIVTGEIKVLTRWRNKIVRFWFVVLCCLLVEVIVQV